MFASDPKARADLKPGTLYAVTGEQGWIYYGQVTAEKAIGFFRRRDRDIADAADIHASLIMAVISVSYPSIGRALRAGLWKKLGRHDLPEALKSPRRIVIWPVGALDVTVSEGEKVRETRIDDPAIQEFEIASAWEADDHIPARLTADFGVEEPAWHVGGPVWRERRLKEELARRRPDQLWHRLPRDWVPTNIQ